jgi:hypothetical protein
MNRSGSFFLGLAVGVAGLYMTMHFTLVRAGDGFHIVPKIAAKAEVPFVDIRKFSLASWQRKQGLALAILRAQKGYLLHDPSLLAFKESTQKILDQYTALPASSARIGG